MNMSDRGKSGIKISKWNMYLQILQGHPTIACTSGLSEAHKKLVKKYIPSKEYSKLLAIGVADGKEVVDLMELGYRVRGLTLGPNNVAYCKERFNINIYEEDVHDMSYGSGTFDAVFMNQCLEHFLSPFVGVLEINCVLRERGRIFTCMPTFKDKLSYHHPSLFTLEKYRALFEATGFKIIYDESDESGVSMVVEKDSNNIHTTIETIIKIRKDLFG